MEREEWLQQFAQKSEEVFVHLPKKFTAENVREEIIFGGIKLVDDKLWWNAAINSTLKRWQKEQRIKKGPAVAGKRKERHGALVWTYIKLDKIALAA